MTRERGFSLALGAISALAGASVDAVTAGCSACTWNTGMDQLALASCTMALAAQ